MPNVKVKAEVETVAETEATNYQLNFEDAFRMIWARYCHEKKKIIFIMYTVRKLRNLAKLKYVFNDQKKGKTKQLMLITGLNYPLV